MRETTSLMPGGMAVCIRDPRGMTGINAAGDVVMVAGPTPVKGCAYTVADITECDGLLFVRLAEMPPTDWWRAGLFRPVRPTSIESLRGLLAPGDAGARVREVV